MRSRALLLAAVALCAPTVHARPQAQPASVRTVLVIHSGAESFPANPTLDSGIREALTSQAAVPIDYFAEYFEADLFPTERASQAFYVYLQQKYQGRRIDVVIAMTGTGLRFVLAHRGTLFPDAPIIFFGAATPDEITRRTGGGVTGVRVGSAQPETLRLALTLHPSTQRVFVIAKGTNEREVSLRAALEGFSQKLSVTYLEEETVPRLLAAVKAVPAGSVILYVWHWQEDPGNIVYADRIAQLVAAAAAVPVYGTSDLYVGTGVVGGVVRRTRETGYRLGELALRVLAGTRPQDIPIEDAPLVPVIDWRQVQRWGIEPARLPLGSQILFREPSAWERYKFYIVATLTALLAQSVLVAGLFIQMARRREAEQAVRRNQAALRQSYDRVRDLGARLLNAQEIERSRLARELHDDIGQQLAVLLIDLQLLTGTAPADEIVAAEAMKHAEDIAKGVHDLSHRLHPERLRLLNLVDALNALCRDVSRSDVTITFGHDEVPSDLPPDLKLCFYRIAQEALQNAVKYSKAQNVSVDVRGASEGIVLTIVDDGVGFDVDAVRGRGLGLITAEERIAAIGGTLEIRTGPGAGTRLIATVAPSMVQNTERS